MRQEVQFLREKLTGLERAKEDERQLLSHQIEDLRGERDRLLTVIEEQAGSVRQLTDQRQPAPAPQEPEQTRKGWRGVLHRLAG